jgi:hypothetical protein
VLTAAAHLRLIQGKRSLALFVLAEDSGDGRFLGRKLRLVFFSSTAFLPGEFETS